MRDPATPATPPPRHARPNFSPDSLPTAAATNRNTAAPIRRHDLTVTKTFQKKFFSLTPFAHPLQNETATVIRGDGVTVGRCDGSCGEAQAAPPNDPAKTNLKSKMDQNQNFVGD